LDKISLSKLLSRIGFSLDKQTAVVVKQAGAAMRRLGWHVGGRSSEPGRPREYHRPSSNAVTKGGASGSHESTHRDAGAQPVGAEVDCPF
jgi:hypothetical protein